MEIKEVFLTRDLSLDVPKFDLPEGFSIRNYRKNDEESWFDIYSLTDQVNKVSSNMFREYFGADQDELAQRQFYVCDDSGRAVGMATAWYNDDFEGQSIGRLHWVAVIPEMQGKRLALPLVTTALQRLKDLGHEECYLRTYSIRKKAIKLYLKLGFQPLIKSDEDRANWQTIAREYGYDELKSFL